MASAKPRGQVSRGQQGSEACSLPARCLVVPVDVGKWSAMALVADHYGEVVVEPFVFALSEPGVQELLSAVEKPRPGAPARGLPARGLPGRGGGRRPLPPHARHPPGRSRHRSLVQLNPAAVKEARSQQLCRRASRRSGSAQQGGAS